MQAKKITRIQVTFHGGSSPKLVFASRSAVRVEPLSAVVGYQIGLLLHHGGVDVRQLATCLLLPPVGFVDVLCE